MKCDGGLSAAASTTMASRNDHGTPALKPALRWQRCGVCGAASLSAVWPSGSRQGANLRNSRLPVCATTLGCLCAGADIVARLQRLIENMAPYPGRCPGLLWDGLTGLFWRSRKGNREFVQECGADATLSGLRRAGEAPRVALARNPGLNDGTPLAFMPGRCPTRIVARLQRLIEIVEPNPGRCPGLSCDGLSGLPLGPSFWNKRVFTYGPTSCRGLRGRCGGGNRCRIWRGLRGVAANPPTDPTGR